MKHLNLVTIGILLLLSGFSLGGFAAEPQATANPESGQPDSNKESPDEKTKADAEPECD